LNNFIPSEVNDLSTGTYQKLVFSNHERD
jgi:hypothetical protein